MKGQVFVLTAGVIISILVVLKGFDTVQRISTERDILDISLEELAFKNVDNEMKQLVVFSSNAPRNITDNVIEFLNFTRSGGDGHSLDFRSLFAGALSNATNQTMNITIFQFLRETDLNVTITLNTSTVQRNSTLLNDSGIWMNNFTFTRGEVYNLTISLPDKGYEENVTIKTRGGKDTYTAFYDLRLISLRATHQSLFQQEVKIS